MADQSLLRLGRAALFVALALGLSAASASASKPKDPVSPLEQQEFFLPELAISSAHVPLEAVIDRLPNQAAWKAAGLTASRFVVSIDPRSGTASNILGPVPLLPGDGALNSITLQGLAKTLGQEVDAVDENVVAAAARSHVLSFAKLLGIDPSQLGEVKATAVTPELWQVSIPQVFQGLPVRYGRVALTISHGNVVTMGTETWGDVAIDPQPYVQADDAVAAAFAFFGGRTRVDRLVEQPALGVIPVAVGDLALSEDAKGALGRGYGHRLAWSFVFERPPALARFEVLVDAHSGEVLSLQDTNQYVERTASGGVYPLTGTGICPDADRCGTMQSGWPMPFANTGFAAPNNFTNSAGVYNWTSGTLTTTLAGRYVRMVDSCGAISASSSTGSIDLGGSNNQHDCTTPGSGGAGNTPASRSGFYELNKLAEQARGWLPGNAWLSAQLTSNMNLNQTCNAFYSPSAGTVNFYRSGGGCRNTGEIAAVFDHEWGHALDDNDAAGALSNSSEGYADIAAIYRLEASCVGYGFFQTLDDGCGQTADGTGFNTNEALTGASYCATDCSGVRDADYAKHSPATPATALGFVCGQCTTGTGPCGRQVHCSAAPVRQAAWDFVARDLVAAPFNLDSQSAFIVGNKVFYQGSGNIGAWHACTCGSSSSGCGSTNGYMQWLAADDDNGNINDGTPHMTAIFNAFDRHGIACSTPTPTNSGCAAGPSGAVTGLVATPGSFQVALAWNAAAGATRYWIFRSEGHAGCSFGKALIAETTATSYSDTQVANGRTYYYSVVPAGASSACYGRAGACVDATPAAVVTPDFSLACSPPSLAIQQGTTGSTTCTVTSTNGFASAVTLACASLPAGASCSYGSNPVTPPANGSVNSTLTVSVAGSTTPGTYAIQAQGTSGSMTRSAGLSLTVTPVATPDFTVSAAPASVSITQGGASAGSTITVASVSGFSAAVNLAVSSLPSGVTATFSTNPVTPPAGGSAGSTLTFTASASAATGTFPLTVSGTSGSLTRNASLSLTVNAPGGGDLTAAFDVARQAPACNSVGRSCDTGPSLVLGRAGLGPEPNQPNTIADSCADGTSGTFHSDESNDRIKVSTVDGTAFAPGKSVRIDATGWVYASAPTSDHVDFFYAADASAPTWTLITTVTPTASQTGAQTFSATYTLPAGGVQAVRVQWRYTSTSAACSAGGYNDRDDLVFTVSIPPTTVVYQDEFETAAGWTTNPNSSDTAISGQWERGDPEQTSSGVVLQLGTTWSGSNDLVTARLAGASAGANDVDGGVTSIQSPAVTLPASGTLSLSFRYYLAHLNNAASDDYFRAFVVVGTTATQVFQSLGAAANRAGAWTPVSVSLNAYAGQTIRIRFDAADAGTGSLIEAGVDSVAVTQQP